MSIERFRRYAGKVVAVQLRRPLFTLSYGGTAMIDGLEQHCTVPAMFPEHTVRTEQGEQIVPASHVGFSEIVPVALCDLTEEGLLLRITDPATKAKLAIDVLPDDVLYITIVEQPPSMLIKPNP